MAIENFLHLPEEKQKQILDCALNEFAEQGYDLASTNQIVKEAGISKGVLFKYFTSKEELFYYIIKTYQEQERTLFQPERDTGELFDLIKEILYLEYQIYRKDKGLKKFYSLYLKMLQGQEHPVYKTALARYGIDPFEFINHHIDRFDESEFKTGLTKETAKDVMYIVSEGIRSYFRNNLEHVFDEDKAMLHKIYTVLDVVKQGMLSDSALDKDRS